MRAHTQVSLSKKSTKHWKTSPPTAKYVPLQHCRPSARLQQAREPVLGLFEPFPVQLRYEEADQSPFKLEARSTYPSQCLRDTLIDTYSAKPIPNEVGQRTEHVHVHVHDHVHDRETAQKPFTMFRFFSFMVLAVASLHLINFGNDSFQGIRSNSVRSGKNIVLSNKSAFVRSSHQDLVRGQSRTFFMGERADSDSPSFETAPGRKVVIFAPEFSDVTQLYGTKSSDDIAISGSIERKFFPLHETNADCAPMSEWQTKSFRE